MTVGELIDRIYREWLHRMGNRVTEVELANAVSDTETTWTLSDGLTPEELSMLSAGTLIEVGSELAKVRTFDQNTNILTVRRGQEGTAAVLHAAGVPVLVAPSHPRIALLAAVGDEIVGLYPELWRVASTDTVIDAIVELPAEAQTFLRAYDLSGNLYTGAQLMGYGGIDSGAAVAFDNNNPYGTPVYAEYTAGFTRPTSEADTLSSLGVDDRWVQLLIISVVANQLRGRELDLSTIEFLTEGIEAQGIRLGTPTDIATALLRYRQLLIAGARQALIQRTGFVTVTNRTI